jgi:hypothetical protein
MAAMKARSNPRLFHFSFHNAGHILSWMSRSIDSKIASHDATRFNNGFPPGPRFEATVCGLGCTSGMALFGTANPDRIMA